MESPISLQDLISRNSRSLLDGKNQVYCGKCKQNTSQRFSSSFESQIIVIEIVRIITIRNEMRRNNSPVYFALKGISLPGCPGTQLVITEAHLLLVTGSLTLN